MLMHKILQNHLLCAFVANLKIGAIYALYPESFCDKNLAIRKVFAFCDSEHTTHILKAIGLTVNLVYLGTLYVHPVTRQTFRSIVRMNWQY